MQNFYFTFGSDSRFPYGRDEYVVVKADNLNIAAEAFKLVHPNRPGSGNVNCSDFYAEEVFFKLCKKYYGDRGPAEVITAKIEVTK